MAIETKDLWQGAYLLTEGGWLDGDGVEDRARRFQDGNATCNLRKFRRQMNHLKDVVFGGMHGE